MSDEFGSDFISLTDEDGNQFELELLDAFEMDGTFYHALVEPDSHPDDPESMEIIILKSVDEDGEEVLSTPDTDEELQKAYDQFMERLFLEDADET